MSRSNATTTVLLENWYSGDAGALDAILERHLPWIESRVRSRLGARLRRKLQTGDIVQEAVVKFLRYGPRIRISSDAAFCALFARIVENVLRDENDRFATRRRDLAHEKPLPSTTVLDLEAVDRGAETPSRVFQKQEQEAWIRLGIELLEPMERAILVQREWDRKSFQDIGNLYGVSRDAARMRVNRALKRLAGLVNLLRRGEIFKALETNPEKESGR
jgi:RNA polymerase sigma factor (sigma-70 family)